MNAATVNKTIMAATQIPLHVILQVTVTLTAIAVTSTGNNLNGVASMTPTTSIL